MGEKVPLHQLLYMLNYERASQTLNIYDPATITDIIKFLEVTHIKFFSKSLRKRFFQKLDSAVYDEEIFHYVMLLGCPTHIFSKKNQYHWLFKLALRISKENEKFDQIHDTVRHFIDHPRQLREHFMNPDPRKRKILGECIRQEYNIQKKEFDNSDDCDDKNTFGIWTRALNRRHYKKPIGILVNNNVYSMCQERTNKKQIFPFGDNKNAKKESTKRVNFLMDSNANFKINHVLGYINKYTKSNDIMSQSKPILIHLSVESKYNLQLNKEQLSELMIKSNINKIRKMTQNVVRNEKMELRKNQTFKPNDSQRLRKTKPPSRIFFNNSLYKPTYKPIHTCNSDVMKITNEKTVSLLYLNPDLEKNKENTFGICRDYKYFSKNFIPLKKVKNASNMVQKTKIYTSNKLSL